MKYRHLSSISPRLLSLGIMLCGLFAMGMTGLLSSCNDARTKADKRLVERTDSFATSFFNWRYVEAVDFCTENARKQLVFLASNVGEGEVEMLRTMEKSASVETGMPQFVRADSAIVDVAVSHFLKPDSIGREAKLVDFEVYRISLRAESGKWLVSEWHSDSEME